MLLSSVPAVVFNASLKSSVFMSSDDIGAKKVTEYESFTAEES